MDNDSGALILLIVLIVSAFLLILIRLAKFVNDFGREKQYLLNEMHRAADYNEYRYWRRELRCLYLCLIPFVTERNVMRVYSVFFHKPKHATKEKRSDGLMHILAPSMLAICICAICLCGASWAWFTSTTSAGTNTIKSATFQISDVQITHSDGTTGVTPREDDDKYPLNQGTYKLSFKADANSTSSKGYCCITVCKDNETAGTNYYTSNIEKDASYTITVVNNESTGITVKIEPIWGDVPNNLTDEEKIALDGTITVGTVKSSSSNGSSNSNTLTEQKTSETTEQTTTTTSSQEATVTVSEEPVESTESSVNKEE